MCLGQRLDIRKDVSIIDTHTHTHTHTHFKYQSEFKNNKHAVKLKINNLW